MLKRVRKKWHQYWYNKLVTECLHYMPVNKLNDKIHVEKYNARVGYHKAFMQ